MEKEEKEEVTKSEAKDGEIELLLIRSWRVALRTSEDSCRPRGGLGARLQHEARIQREVTDLNTHFSSSVAGVC